ncbi:MULTISPECIES: hypothetical protein [unclassified Pseudoalteromonas]|uniref:hypothetical protein n=1 Tax=unclassified Pseudoalteromonas TaxID=194690 RepID=UPI0030144644
MSNYFSKVIFDKVSIFTAIKVIISNLLWPLVVIVGLTVAFSGDFTWAMRVTIGIGIMLVLIILTLLVTLIVFPISIRTEDKKQEFYSKSSADRGKDVGEYISGWI